MTLCIWFAFSFALFNRGDFVSGFANGGSKSLISDFGVGFNNRVLVLEGDLDFANARNAF